MKKRIFPISLLAAVLTCSISLQAQSYKEQTQKKETIIIEDDGSSPNQTTIEIYNGDVYLDGKKVTDGVDDRNKRIKITKRKRGANIEQSEELNTPFGMDMQEAKPMLGVTTKATPDNSGAEIVSVLPKSPAEKLGLQQGDIITMVDGKTILSPKELVEAIEKHKSGDHIDLTFERNNKAMTKDVVLTDRDERMMMSRSFPFGGDNDMMMDMPSMFKPFFNDAFGGSMSPAKSQAPKIGVSVEDRADGDGVLVNETTPGSPAQTSGIVKGDVITKVADTDIGSVDDLTSVIIKNQGKQTIPVEVKRNGVLKKLTLNIPKTLKKKEL